MFFFILLQKVQNEQQLLEKGNEEGKRKNTKKQKPKLHLSNGQSVSQSVSQLLFGQPMDIPFGVGNDPG